MKAQLKVRLDHSPIGFDRKQRETVKGLGLRRLYQVRQIEDTKATRGMVAKVPHLVSVVDEKSAKKGSLRAKK